MQLPAGGADGAAAAPLAAEIPMTPRGDADPKAAAPPLVPTDEEAAAEATANLRVLCRKEAINRNLGAVDGTLGVEEPGFFSDVSATIYRAHTITSRAVLRDLLAVTAAYRTRCHWRGSDRTRSEGAGSACCGPARADARRGRASAGEFHIQMRILQ